MLSKSEKIAGIVSVVVTLPIRGYLWYKILEYVHASELMWFLFWVYFPLGLLVTMLSLVGKEQSQKPFSMLDALTESKERR